MSASAARFEVVAGKASGMSILVEDELVIGRQAEGAGRLAEDDEISRAHARVSVDTSGFCAIEDLGSTNGTFVNGLRISSPQTLTEGDTIELGGTTLVVGGLPPLEQDSVESPATERGEAPAPQGAAPDSTPATIIPGAEELMADAGAAPAQPSPAPPLNGSEVPSGGAVSLSLELAVDYLSREVTMTIQGQDRPFRFVFDGQHWRPATTG
jgi:FHA domain-containing protein